MKQLPDIALSFQKMLLQDDIAACTHQSLFAQTCAANVYNNYNAVIGMMRDQFADNPTALIDMFGKNVIKRLVTLHGVRPDVIVG